MVLMAPWSSPATGVNSESGALNQAAHFASMGKTAPWCRRFLVTDSAADQDVAATKHVGQGGI